MRLPDTSVGRYVDGESPEGIPLRGVGLNQCQTGWMLQGYILRDGSVRATPHFLLPYAKLPTGPAGSPLPGVPGQTLSFDFTTASAERLDGKFEVVGADGKPVLSMQIDEATPVGVSTGRGIGAQACFTTGFYEVTPGGHVGPVSAVWDEKTLYYAGVRLSERHGIGIWLSLEPAHRQPQNVIRGNLQPESGNKRQPFRVVFETRKTSAAGVEFEEVPAETGKFMGSFLKANPQGPLRVELEGVVMPNWDGPLAGETIESLKIETLIVTDIDGPQVPVPTSPAFGAQEKN